MLCLKDSIQCILDFQRTLSNFLAVTNVFAECCNLGSNFRFLFSVNGLLFRGRTANLILELGALAYQGF